MPPPNFRASMAAITSDSRTRVRLLKGVYPGTVPALTALRRAQGWRPKASAASRIVSSGSGCPAADA